MDVYQTELLNKFFENYEKELPEFIKDYFECSYNAYKMDKENQHELEGHH